MQLGSGILRIAIVVLALAAVLLLVGGSADARASDVVCGTCGGGLDASELPDDFETLGGRLAPAPPEVPDGVVLPPPRVDLLPSQSEAPRTGAGALRYEIELWSTLAGIVWVLYLAFSSAGVW